ncbi:MAG TPA: DNA (cytosine-5-)-methyltransferase [Gallicola sp.]|nr:DNA (cytosine-5-)-methyltransferase [Gallicola sp.]HQD92886.1 DNA (cytosine-5-)-methyltransferase [Bacilli bacterium]
MRNKKNNREIRVVELFAGVGGFRLAFERTSKSFKTIWANQWEPGKKNQWAFDCYVSHFGDCENHVNKDIATVINEVPSHDLLVGGFPCQDYSVARSNANGIEGKKGVLWWSIRDIIVKENPLFILLENVDRLIKSPSKQIGRDFGIMLRTLNDAGYNVEWRVINAADYGYAQRRRRIFIFAFDKKITSKIYHTNNQDTILLRDGFYPRCFPVEENHKKSTCINIIDGYKDLEAISNTFTAKFYNSGLMIDGQILSLEVQPIVRPCKTLNDIIESNVVNEKFYINELEERFRSLKKHKKVRRINPEGEIYIYSEGSIDFPDPLNKPARTLLTSEGLLNRSTHVILDPKTNRLRLLTPLECERINGFDDDWTNTGMPLRYRYFCMGNALVVPAVEEIAKRFIEIWEVINDK